MAIDRKEASHVADLAMLDLSEEEIDRLSVELSAILDFFDKLREADIEGVEPHRGAPLSTAPEREDTPGESVSNDEALREAPDKEGGLFRVPRVIG